MNPAPLPMELVGAGPRAPKVSVAMVTYNHVAYITHAVESVLAQRTDFDFELLVGDDVSSDGTRELLRGLAARHPERLRLVLHRQNLGLLGKRNLAALVELCRGEYLSFLDGDDFWSSPEKLQFEVDFLDAHREFSACCHDVWTLDRDGTRRATKLGYPEEVARVTAARMLTEGFPHISTIMVRRALLPRFPDWFFEVAMGDWTIGILCARQGPVAFFRDRPMSTYRLHNTSHWLGRPLLDRTRDEIFAMETFDRHLQGEGRTAIQRHINRREFYLVDAYYRMDRPAEARAAFWAALRKWQRCRGVPVPWVMRYLVRACFPGLARWRERTRTVAKR